MKSFLSNSKVKALSALLVVAMLAQLLANGAGVVADAETTASEDGMTISNFAFLIKDATGAWVEPDEETAVINGQMARVQFDYAIVNNSHAKNFSVDFKQYAKNFSLTDVGSADAQVDLIDDSGEKVGTYYLSDGVLYVELNDEFATRSNITGTGAYFQGMIDAPSVNDEGKATVGFGDVTYTVPLDLNLPTSSVNFYKTSGSTTYGEDGEIYQEYKIVVQSTGDNTNIIVSDTPGTKLSAPSNITMNGEAYSGTFPITIEQMADGEKIEIVYTCEVDSSVMAPDANLWGDEYRNKANVTYTNNKDEDVTSNSYSANVTVNRPSVNKVGKLTTETYDWGWEPMEFTYVDWTITINVGDLTFDDITSFTDTLGNYQMNIYGSSAPTLTSFTDMGNGTYQCTYRTMVTNDALESDGSVALQNTAEITYTYGEDEYTISSTGTVNTPAKSGVSKEFVSFDYKTGLFTWKATVIIPEDGYSALSLLDKFTVNDEHYFVEGSMKAVLVDGDTSTDLVLGVSSYDEYWNLVWTPEVYDYSISTQVNDLGVWGMTIDFVADHLAEWAGKTIEITYQSRYAENPLWTPKNGTVTNQITENFTDASGNTGSGTAEVTYKMLGAKTTYPYRSSWPTTVGSDALTWKINLALSEHPELVAGDVITVTDTLPDNMILDESSVLIDTAFWNDYYFGEDVTLDAAIMGALSYTYDKDANKVTFEVTLTQEILDLVAQLDETNSVNGYVSGLYIGYVTKVDDAQEFIAASNNGENAVAFTNECTFAVNDTQVGEASLTQNLTPSAVLTKDGGMNSIVGDATDGAEPRKLHYTITVNPDGYRLSDGGYLTLTDVSGSALVLDITTVKITDGNGTELDASKWSVGYDYETRTATFVVPDGMKLIITYTMDIALNYGDAISNNNASNTVSISGVAETVSKDEQNREITISEEYVPVDAKIASIKIYKGYQLGDSFQPLDGAEFLLTPVIYNTETGEYESAVAEGNKTIAFTVNSITNGVVLVTGLKYDQVYALTETKAPDGYAKSTDTFYFYVPSPDEAARAEVECSEDTEAYNARTIYYENEPLSEEPTPTPTPTATATPTATPTPVTYTAHYVYLGTDGQYHEIANDTFTAPTESNGDGYTTGTQITVLGSDAFDSTDAVQAPYTESGYTLTWLVYEDGVDITEATEGSALLDMSTYDAMTSKDSLSAGSTYTIGSSNVYFVAQLTTDVTVKVDVTFVDGGNTSKRPDSLDVTLNDTDGETTLTTTEDALTDTTVDGYTAAQSGAGTLLDGTYPVLDDNGKVIDYSELGIHYTVPDGYSEYQDVYTTEEDGVVTYHIVLKRTYNTTYYVAGSEVTYDDASPNAGELAETVFSNTDGKGLPTLTTDDLTALDNPADKYKIVWQDIETGEIYEQGEEYTIPARDVTLVAMVVENTENEIRPRFAYNFVSYMGSYELPGTMLAKRLAMDYTNGEDLTQLITYINCDAATVAADATGKYYYLTIMTGCPKDINEIIFNVGLNGFDATPEYVYNFTGADSVTTFKAYKTAKEHQYTDLLAGDEYLDTYQGMVMHKFVIPVDSIDTLYLTTYYDYNEPEMFWGQYEFVIADKVATVK